MSPGKGNDNTPARFYRLLEECEISGGNYFRKLDDGFLVSVILGDQCPVEPSYVQRLLKKVGLSSVPVLRARIAMKTYQILWS